MRPSVKILVAISLRAIWRMLTVGNVITMGARAGETAFRDLGVKTGLLLSEEQLSSHEQEWEEGLQGVHVEVSC